MVFKMTFILDDFSRDKINGKPKGDVFNYSLKWLGHALVMMPFEQHTVIDFTGPPGCCSSLYYSLAFQLGKWEYMVQKADEWIEVSPVHAQYYQLTQKQKEELEGRIKAGLASAAQAVADMELLKHDQRRYLEFLNYFGWEYANELKQGKRDEHSLKAVFIDQVDMHTGDGISMRSIVSRWPTLITDFMKLADSDTDPEKVKKKLEITKAEAVVLVTKNKLYQEWKKIFEPEMKTRFLRINELVKSREKSVEQYREWLKPVIARHKLIEEGLARPDEREKMRTFFIPTAGTATSLARIVLWTWKPFISPELYKGGSEEQAKKPVDCYDEWTKRNLIFHKNHGLITKWPWITDEWIKKKKKEIYNSGWMNERNLYYSFFEITLDRSNTKSVTGEEIENGMFDVNSVFMSQNALFAKMLDLKAKQEEMNRHVDSLLGVGPKPVEGSVPEFNKNDIMKPAKDFLKYFSIGFQFFKRGPYERDFDERITKFYLAPVAVARYGPIIAFIKKKIGMGVA